MVAIFLPTTADTGSTQLRVAWPSICTVQAPHWAMPQPNLVPVRLRLSRSTHSSGVSSAASVGELFAVDVEREHRERLREADRWKARIILQLRHEHRSDWGNGSARHCAALARGGAACGHRNGGFHLGSAPRPAGSLLVCNDAGQFAGSVSGGCVEVAVIEAATEVMRTGAPTLLEYGVSDEQAFGVGLACGGRIRVYVEALE